MLVSVTRSATLDITRYTLHVTHDSRVPQRLGEIADQIIRILDAE